MANRILRDWTKSDKINNLSFNAEILFVRLIMNADDFGCFYAEPKLLKSFCFPLKNIRETDITLWLHELVSNGLIALYDAENKQYLEIYNFNQRLRQKNRKYPENQSFKQNEYGPHALDGQVTVNSSPETEVETEVETETEGVVDFGGLLFPKTHIDHCAKFTTDKISLETFMQQYRIKSLTALKSHLMDFNKHLNIEGKKYEQKDFKDFKKHFLNWFRITYKPEIPSSNKSKSNFREEYGV